MLRRLLINELERWANSPSRKPLLLYGARQVGKSFLLANFAKKMYRVVHSINFEVDHHLRGLFESSIEPKTILQNLSLQTGKKIDIDKDVLLLDEIQACPKALHSLKYFQERLPQLSVLAAGSLLGVALSDQSFPVGKIDELTLFPLNFHEFLLAIDEKIVSDYLLSATIDSEYQESFHLKLWHIFRLYLIIGGLPEVVLQYLQHKEDLFTAFNTIREKQRLIISNYLKDMAKHAGAANALHLERIFRSIPAQLARVNDDSVKRYRFTGVVPGISQYSRFASAFDWLNGAGLIYKVPIIDSAKLPLTQSVKESIFKVYIFDIGILGALGDIPPKVLYDYNFGTYKGYIAENFVLQSLKTQGISSVYGWNEGKAEVEFLITGHDGIIPVEVKSGNVRQPKSLAQYIRKYSPDRAYIFGARLPKNKQQAKTKIFHRPLYLASFGQLGVVR